MPLRCAPWLALLLALPATGQAVDTSAWECNFCPFDDQDPAEIEAGSLYADGVEAKFGEFDGISEDGGYLVLDGRAGERQEDGRFWNVAADDLGLDNRSLALATGREAAWRVGLGYLAAPHNVFDTTVTPFDAAPADALSLPAGWVRAGSTQLMPALDGSLRRYDLGTTRERWSLDGELERPSGLRTELRYTHETRDGQRLRGSNFVVTSSQLASPVDYVTDQVDWSARYATRRGSIGISYFGSFFTNDRPAYTWDNPFTAIAPGADLGRAALEPDNDHHQFGVQFSHAFSPTWQFRLNGSVGRSSQDERFLPYTSNALIVTAPLPRASADGDVDTTHFDVQLVGRLGEQFGWFEGLHGKLSYRYDERDNGTPQAEYDYVESDTFPGGLATNLPYGYQREKFAATGDYDVARLLWPGAGRPLRISAGWDREEWDRTFQPVKSTTEDRGWVRLAANPLAWLSLDVRYGAANRDAGPYLADPGTGAPQNPLLRKYNLADRERDFWDAGLQLSLPGSVAVGLGGFRREDEYVDTAIGLTHSRDTGATVDLSWAIRERIFVSAFYGHQEIRGNQAGSQSFGAPDWRARSQDEFDTASIGVRADGIGERWDLRFDYFFIDGQGDIEMQGGGAGAFPSLRTRSHGPSLEAAFQATPALGLVGTFRYEHFDADDWALDGVEPDTLPSVLASGADAHDYDAILVGLSFRYRFGGSTRPAAPADQEP
jgi:MtrB/PioB family decaheme-associated outer membrane protein